MKIEIAVLGFEGTGKKTFISKYTEKPCIEKISGLYPYFAKLKKEHGSVNLILWYINPNCVHEIVESGFFKLVDGVMILGDVSNPNSYEIVPKIQKSMNLKYQAMPIYFVNNKQDLFEESHKEPLVEFLLKKNKYAFIPISLKTGFNDNKPMDWMVEEIIESKYLRYWDIVDKIQHQNEYKQEMR